MKITPRFLPTHAIQAKTEVIAEKGDFILFNEDEILVLSEDEFKKLYQVEVSPLLQYKGPTKKKRASRFEDKFNKDNGPGKVLTLFGTDACGQFLDKLSIKKLTELVKQAFPETTVGSYLVRLKAENLVEIVDKQRKLNQRPIYLYSLTEKGKSLLYKWFPIKPYIATSNSDQNGKHF